jgi:uncharacterized protein YbaR (Trm112 family)
MIKILEHGIRKITCPNCKAKLQYEQDDIQETEVQDNILTDGEVRKYIICPDCDEIIFLTPRKR